MIPGDPYGQALTVGSVPAGHAASPVTRDKVAVTDGERRLTWRSSTSGRRGPPRGLSGTASGRASRSPCTRETGLSTSSSCTGWRRPGCPVVPLSPRFVAAEVLDAVSATGARALVTDSPGSLGLPAAGPRGALAVARLAAGSRDFPALAGDVQPYEDILASADPAGPVARNWPSPMRTSRSASR